MTPPPTQSSTRAQRAFYWFCWHALMLIFTFVYRLRRFHMERLPRTGGCIIAANHQSHLDPPVIGMGFTTRPLHFLAREGLFKNRFFAWLITALNAFPISEDASDIGAIRTILARLESGVPVLIFPEGSRTPDGEIHEFQRGIALLLKRAKCPVVPVAIEGAYDAFPRGRKFPKLTGRRIAIMFGEPIPHDVLLNDGAEAGLALLRSKIEHMRRELQLKLRAPGAKASAVGLGGNPRAADPPSPANP